MKILVANIGSTSFKYRLFETGSGAALAEGRAERCLDYDAAIRRCLDEVGSFDAVGFKAVHAGPLSGARLVDEEVLEAMERFSFHAPAHNPPYIAAMRAFQRVAPGVPLVAVFETAFFDAMPDAATTYAVPWAWREELGVRRYGFHGASHRAAGERVQELLGRSDLRHISCHLGGSSSVAAIRDGVAVDMSFGISPQSGLPQNNRCGDIDAFAVLYVMKRLGLGVEEMAGILATQSGLAGISGGSGDVRDLLAAGDARARLALDVFVRSVRHYIGAFLVELGRLDVLTFSGGIGENSAEVREAICAGLSGLGIELGPERNRDLKGEGQISRGPVQVWVIPADEERIVAAESVKVVQQ